MFGVEKPADAPPDEDTAALLASLESDPTADLDEGNGGAMVEELALEDFLEIPPMLEELPGAESGTELASLDLPIEPTDDEGSEGIAASDDVVAVIAPPAEIGSTQPTASGGMGVLGYGGLALAGVGAAAAGTGAYFGYSAGAKRDSIKYGAGGTLQSRALELEGEANDAAGRANLLFAVAAALIGGALVVVDMLTGDAPPEANVIVGVEPGGASLAWRVVW